MGLGLAGGAFSGAWMGGVALEGGALSGACGGGGACKVWCGLAGGALSGVCSGGGQVVVGCGICVFASALLWKWPHGGFLTKLPADQKEIGVLHPQRSHNHTGVMCL